MSEKEPSSSGKKSTILPMIVVAIAAFLLGAGAFGLIQKGKSSPETQLNDQADAQNVQRTAEEEPAIGEDPSGSNVAGADGQAAAPVQENVRSGAETQVDTGSLAADAYIGEAAAKEAALADAGVQESDTAYMNCYLDHDDGRAKYYKVEFFIEDTEYEYEIDLYSGTVLERSMDTHNIHHGHSGTAGKDSGSYIGEDAAWAAALGHAGLEETEVRKKKVKLDEEDGVMVYEVEFEKGRTEYDYEIHAVSGEVLKAETDME